MQLTDRVTLLPYLHGRAAFAGEVRKRLLERHYDLLAVDIPDVFENDLPAALDYLPIITALCARGAAEPYYYLPLDPCDASIEVLRQGAAGRIPTVCIGSSELLPPRLIAALPDEYAARSIGFDRFCALCLAAVGRSEPGSHEDREALHLAHRLHELENRGRGILCLVHLRVFAAVVHHFARERSWNYQPGREAGWNIKTYCVNTDHLYFALGELPFVTGKYEQSRYDPFALPVEPVELVKELFRETRDNYYESSESPVELSPARIQVGLAFLRNLTVQASSLMPSLFDIVTAAKGVGGNAYAVRMLKSARYYPFLPIDTPCPTMSVGIDQVRLEQEQNTRHAVNLFKDTVHVWKTLAIKPDPGMTRKQRYRYRWNPMGMCSHVPEDERIERFNGHVRSRALRIRAEDQSHSEKFLTSVKDGIDIRETLRNWYSGDIYVRELPPGRGTVDTAIIIFDNNNDERYPHRGTWYAEHPDESTLTFYATDPFENLIGPGVARCEYGGLSLLFPPRPVPSAFAMNHPATLHTAAHLIAWGAMLFSKERVVAYVAAQKPDLALRTAARTLKKHLVWIPLSSFSSETLRRLRRFHVLNGKEVRSWATRFIGD